MDDKVYTSMTARELLQDDQGMRKEFRSADAVCSIEKSSGPQNPKIPRLTFHNPDDCLRITCIMNA